MTRAAQDRRRAEGLSAPVGNLHRAGTARPRAGRARPGDRLAEAARPTASAIRCMTRSARPCAICPNICTTSRCGCCAALAGRPAAAGFGAALARLRRRSPARLHPQPRPALRPGAGAGCRMAGRRDTGCTPISSIRRPRWRAMRACCRPRLDLLGACQGHLDLARLGAGGEARRGPLDGHLHPHAATSGCEQARRRRSATSISAITGSTCRGSAPRRRRADGAGRQPTRPTAVHPQRRPGGREEGLRRRCSRRWRCCRVDLAWRFEHIGGGDQLPALEGAGRGARHCRPDRLARRAGAGGRCWPATARPISSRWPAGSRPTATATACRMCWSRRRASGSPASRRRCPAFPSFLPTAKTDWSCRPRTRQALAAALQRAIRDPALRQRLGEAAEAAGADAFRPSGQHRRAHGAVRTGMAGRRDERAPRVLFYVQHLLGIGHLARASRIARRSRATSSR